MVRDDLRGYDIMRPFKVTRHYMKHAEGSVLVELGDTKVICTASCEETVPHFLRDSGRGWVTAEYGMLPRSCSTRRIRDTTRGKIDGRSQEIQRLIGRSLRAVVDLKKLGERTIWIDCDVIQADGGTRTVSITGAFIALCDAITFLKKEKRISETPIIDFIAAVSVGICEGTPLLDLCYKEDSKADVDMNIVMTGAEKFIEVQGTAEHTPFTDDEFQAMLALARKGITELIIAQKKALEL